MPTWENVDWPRLKRHVSRLARIDPLFRAYLLASPRDALSSITGCAIPDDIRISAITERPGVLYVTVRTDADQVFHPLSRGILACDALDRTTCQAIVANLKKASGWQEAGVTRQGKAVVAPDVRSA